jgi:PTS system N-acetylglucosamine-specific IIC component
MAPIAVLPLAGLLLRLGQPDLLNIPFLAAAGDAIFTNLGLIFAIGVAMGLARDNNGAAALAGAVCFLVAVSGAKTLIPAPQPAGAGTALAKGLVVAGLEAKALAKLAVPMGILSGVVGGAFYNRFATLKLPDYLAFFGGRRFVPIVSGLAGLVLAAVFGGSYAGLSSGMDRLSGLIVSSGPVGLFCYGLLNRLLIVTGLHHILNNVVWFLVGDFHGATGDLTRFFAGDPSAGAFMAGFFPVMMFALPGACLAMYRSARPERRAAVGGMLLSLALTACLTGVTEPIEFSFMFLAPALFGLHAVLTGLCMVLMDALGVKLGFGFSAGLFDYVLNFGRATRPLLLVPVGLLYGGLYYALFRVFIVRFDLKTPGREPLEDAVAPPEGGSVADAFVTALGGAGNLLEVAACTTRLRLILSDAGLADEAGLRALGAKGFVRPSKGALQVVLGPTADLVAGEIRAALTSKPRAAAGPPALRALLDALGGEANLTAIDANASRVRLVVAKAEVVREGDLRRHAGRGFARPAPTVIHLLVGPGAQDLAAALRRGDGGPV